MTMKDKFICSRCGLCCMQLHRNKMYKELDRGDGICKHFNVETKLCEIYLERPIICRIDDMYEKYFIQFFTKVEYYNLNYTYCLEFQGNKKEIIHKKAKISLS